MENLNPRSFGAIGNGVTDDTVAMQKCIDAALTQQKSILLDSVYLINGSLDVTKKLRDKRIWLFELCGINKGGFKKATAGFLFDATDIEISDFQSNGVYYDMGVAAVAWNFDKIIRVFFSKNYFCGLGAVGTASTKWLQSIRMSDCVIVNHQVPAITFAYAFDCTFDNNLVESGAGFLQNIIVPNASLTQQIFNIRIINNCMEGLTGTPIRLGRIRGGTISGNYFETNRLTGTDNSYINLSMAEEAHAGLTVSNNTCEMWEDQEKVCYLVDYGKVDPDNTPVSFGNFTNSLLHTASKNSANVNFLISNHSDFAKNGFESPDKTITRDLGQLKVGGVNIFEGLGVTTAEEIIPVVRKDQELSSSIIMINTSALLVPYIERKISISFDMKVANDAIVTVYPYQNSGITIKNPFDFSAKTTYQRFNIEGVMVKNKPIPPNFSTGAISFFCFAQGLPANFKIFIKNIKIEAGDFATSYSLSEKQLLETVVSQGITVSRPLKPVVGFMYFDTSLGYPIYWNGTKWVNSIGTAV
ncbi:hypothetical protein HDE69_000264 [Pedobacter cryoconitis]|uniref:Pectate lyase superfamily protein domain-containing protein n=1 Tax=Pedobacter cryoconitis TaxID=188932 RepID=A0A7W8YPN0_9SPHI|nr:hypothetical protein [Pedobacter cryoconitis]MBB5619228.1 hypothetical protein [Pedobacter cryoconitis]